MTCPMHAHLPTFHFKLGTLTEIEYRWNEPFTTRTLRFSVVLTSRFSSSIIYSAFRFPENPTTFPVIQAGSDCIIALSKLQTEA